jgi:hypothetical protein
MQTFYTLEGVPGGLHQILTQAVVEVEAAAFAACLDTIWGEYEGWGTLTEEIAIDHVLGVGQCWVIHSEFPVKVITHLHLHLVDFMEFKHSLCHKCSGNCLSMYDRR